jgi:hypothetical protein
MQDQHFIRDWNDVHGDFTADLHSTLNGLGRYQRTRDRGVTAICSPYDRILDRRRVEPSRHELSPAANASLRGLAASVITVVFWAAVMLVATPAPGLAADPGAPAEQTSAYILLAPELA